MPIFLLPFIIFALFFIAIFLLVKIFLELIFSQYKILGADYFKLNNLFNKIPVSLLTKLVTNRKKIETLAKQAMLENTFSIKQVLSYKEAGGWLAVIFILIIYYYAPLDQTVLIGALLVGLAWFWPELYLLKYQARVKREAESSLANLIDLIRLQVAAGHNLEQAITNVSAESSGLWKIILTRVVYRLKAGLSLDESLQWAASIINSPDFNKFLAVLKQSQILGASLSGTLTIQAKFLRGRRKARAENDARTASVKIALPLVLCIFPALLIIYLAPAILRIVYDI